MLHGADDGVDHDLEARRHDGFVAGVGDGCVGDCVRGKKKRGVSGGQEVYDVGDGVLWEWEGEEGGKSE